MMYAEYVTEVLITSFAYPKLPHIRLFVQRQVLVQMLESQPFMFQLRKALNVQNVMPNAQTDEQLWAAWQESWQAFIADTLAAG